EIVEEAFDATRTGIGLPGPLSATTGPEVALATGDSVLPRIRFAFAPSVSGSVTGYAWQYRRQGRTWQSGGRIDAEVDDGAGNLFGHVAPVAAGALYDIRVKADSTRGYSGWRTLTGVLALGPEYTLDAPTEGTATGGTGAITVTFRLPNDRDVRGAEIFGADEGDSSAAVKLGETLYAGANTTVSLTEEGLGAATTRHYFARTIGPFGSVSPFSAGAAATTDP
uniref:hypothetical protein n=1 Tax=Oceanicella sp. SM1341 TaxID=1548889 RepID=UPI00130047AC